MYLVLLSGSCGRSVRPISPYMFQLEEVWLSVGTDTDAAPLGVMVLTLGAASMLGLRPAGFD